MNGDQALELKELERDYEAVLGENCRVFVWYFKVDLENGDENVLIDLPSVVLEMMNKGYEFVYKKIEVDESVLKNGRYNPIRADEEKLVEFKKAMSRFPSFSREWSL